ncbi:ciliated left-right organizer metallopeptidase isoform X2 [Lampris incognitus]|uniref:ciliated left-right organizer metallopeptidase isoform X2 n=1 Tax=Lampris incognitus TaxID=2546036 RepID=UPI0024B5C2FE|nr:ciliated left-right organizer metallopeptidase isoform X2 [Lampris incognitus]
MAWRMGWVPDAAAIIMASPPSRRLWVGVLLVVMAELPEVLQKCIFDDVQSQVRVVTAALFNPESSPTGTRTSSHTGRDHTDSSRVDVGHINNHLRRRASPRRTSSTMQRRSQRGLDLPVPVSPRPIRIRTWLPRDSVPLSQTESDRLHPAVEQAVGIVSSCLSVNPVPGRLLLSRDVNKYCKFLWRNSSTANFNRCGRANENYRTETCLDVTIPDDHLGGCDVYPDPNSPVRTVLRPEGAGLPDTDFLLYLHAKTTDRCRAEPSVLAYAAHCQTGPQGRPLAGVAVICKDRLTRDTFSHHSTVQTVIHELFHVLGFSKELFGTWRDCSSSYPQAGVGCFPWRKVTHADKSGQMRIYTQSVITALQNHLTSTDPQLGAPLENLDVLPGGVSSHWESRVMQGSIMAAVLPDPAAVRIDPLTLAALQDTGWYSVDFSRAQSLVWGEGEGAMFGSLSTCQDTPSSFFCIGSGLGCHYLHLHKGECNTDEYLEGCSMYKPLRNGSECWKEENGRGSAEEDRRGEIYGLGSRCFFSNLTRESLLTPPSQKENRAVEGRCYRHRCVGPNRYQVLVAGSRWTDCPAGGAIQAEGYQGLVFCPNKRLCWHRDIAPPPDNVKPFSAASTANPSTSESFSRTSVSTAWETRTPTSLPNVTGHPAEPVMTAVISTTVAVFLLTAIMAAYKKRHASRVGVHTYPEDLSSSL